MEGRKGKSELQPHYNNPRSSIDCGRHPLCHRGRLEKAMLAHCSLERREGDRGTEFIGGMRAISPPPPRVLLSDRSKLYMAGRPLLCKDISIL